MNRYVSYKYLTQTKKTMQPTHAKKHYRPMLSITSAHKATTPIKKNTSSLSYLSILNPCNVIKKIIQEPKKNQGNNYDIMTQVIRTCEKYDHEFKKNLEIYRKIYSPTLVKECQVLSCKL